MSVLLFKYLNTWSIDHLILFISPNQMLCSAVSHPFSSSLHSPKKKKKNSTFFLHIIILLISISKKERKKKSTFLHIIILIWISKQPIFFLFFFFLIQNTHTLLPSSKNNPLSFHFFSVKNNTIKEYFLSPGFELIYLPIYFFFWNREKRVFV